MEQPLKGFSILWIGEISKLYADLSRILKEAGATVINPDPPRQGMGDLIVVDLGSVNLAKRRLTRILSCGKPVLFLSSDTFLGRDFLLKLRPKRWNVVGIAAIASDVTAFDVNLVVAALTAPLRREPQPSPRPARKPKAKALRQRAKKVSRKRTQRG